MSDGGSQPSPLRRTTRPTTHRNTAVKTGTQRAANTGAGILVPGPLKLSTGIVPTWKPIPPRRTMLVSVIRPDDLVAIRFEFVNLVLRPSSDSPRAGASLVRAGTPAYLIMYLPSQSIAEKAYFEAPGPGFDETDQPPPETPDLPGEVSSRLSGWSRLVFKVPEKITSIPYSLTEILRSISTFGLNVAPTALPPSPQLLDRPPTVAPPQPHETAIEAPYRLIISPSIFARWAHSPLPVKHGGRTELWHSRLAVKSKTGNEPDEVNSHHRTIRAIWSPDYHPLGEQRPHFDENRSTADPPGFRTPLDNRDRDEIVHLSANFQIPDYLPLPIQVRRLMLSSLGAWLDSHGKWAPPSGLSLQEWHHAATMGRDHHVKVVYAGYLFPFGHKASLVKVTERKFVAQAVPPGIPSTAVAYLKQRMYVVVREPEKQYPALGQPWNGRRMPYKSIRITTLITPNLADPTNPEAASQINKYGQRMFWVQVPTENAQTDFLFHFVATDWDGNTSEFMAPLIFVDRSLVFAILIPATAYPFASPISISLSPALSIIIDPEVENSYTNEDNDSRRRVSMSGQSIAFAPSKLVSETGSVGETAFETASITWTAELFDPDKIMIDEKPAIIDLQTNDQPAFFPAMDEADIRIAAIEQLTNTTLTDPGSPAEAKVPKVPTISYQGDIGGISNQGENIISYLRNGFDSANVGEVFARIRKGVRLDLYDSVQKVGGLVTPSMDIVGLSRLTGAVGGEIAEVENEIEMKIEKSLSDLADGTFDAAKALLKEAKIEAKILGGIPLSKIVKSVSRVKDGIEKFKTKVSKILSRIVYDNMQMPKELEVTMHWELEVESWEPNHAYPLFDAKGMPPLVIDAKLTKPFDPSMRTSYTVDGVMNGPFGLNLFPGGAKNVFIHIEFGSLEFHSRSGGKTSISAELIGVDFRGPLKFIQELAKKIAAGGFANAPAIDVTASGVKASYSLAVPTVPIGAIILSNLKLRAELNLPFTGAPARFRFAVSEREHPFTITYTVFGGSGFFGIALGFDGLEMMEGALDFGAYISLDLGVASGGAYAAAGIYFKIETNPDDAVLSGYFQCGGCLEVLGLIAIGTEFYMGLTYDSADDSAKGRASVVVEVEVLFFHKKITLGPLEKRFGHSPAPPTFGDMIPLKAWEDYVNAFA